MRKMTKLLVAGVCVGTLGAGLPVGSVQAAKTAKHPVPAKLRGTWKSVKHPRTRQVHIAHDYYYLEKNHTVDFGLLHAKGYKLSKHAYRITGYAYTSGRSGSAARRTKLTVHQQGRRIGLKGHLTGLSAKHFTWFAK